VGREREANALIARLQKQVTELDAAVPSGPHPLAFFEIWSQPLQGVAPGSLQGHFMERAGFKNIVPETRNEMPLLSSEWVAGATPDVIFHTGLTSADHIAARAGWKRIPAVKTNGSFFWTRICFLGPGRGWSKRWRNCIGFEWEVGP
jgi:ABC-type Fe3+-hydroxamate transport system substrate-binding protein